MNIDLDGLLERAFFTEQVRNATEAVARAREQFAERTRTEGVSFELVAPPQVDEAWVRERLARPLVYFCESEGRPIPRCAGAFVSLFTGDRLHCIAASDAIAWAAAQLHTDNDELLRLYGTHEVDTALR
jgi:hypothetical protein